MKYLMMGAAAAALVGCTSVLQDGEVAEAPDVVEAEVVEAADAIEAEAASVADTAEMAPKAFDYAGVIAASEGRPEADIPLYETRKSLEVLTFTGVQPGMTVVEMEAGDGFYTELLASVVGDEGKVYQQNPAQFDTFLGTSIDDRGHLVRLPNIEYIKTPFDAMGMDDGSADMVTWFLGPHELWFVPDGAEMGLFGGTESSFAEIARVLKPGGVFVALDHSAPEGAPATTGGDTHRIDKAIVIEMAAAAGLTLVDESDILANPEDDLTVNVFDPSVRRKTDRFLLKFEK